MKSPPLSPPKRRNRKSPSEDDAPVPFKVFIGYADVRAVRRAMITVADAVRSSRRNVQVQPMAWRYAQLESAHWRDRAVSAALEADVIVLASSEKGDLPAGVEAWVNAFLAANRGRRATLVAVAGTSDAWTICIEQPIAKPVQAAAPVAVLTRSSEKLVA